MNKQGTGKKITTQLNFAKKFNQAIFECNPKVDYMEFDHMTGEKIRYGRFKQVTDTTRLNFECRISFIYRHKQTGEETRANLYYITHDHQSLSLTIFDLDAIVKCYGVDMDCIELIYARSLITPLLDARLNELVKMGEVTLKGHNVRLEFIDFKFPIC